MLGEKIAEIKATAVTKILPANGSKPRFETATEGSGTVLGVEVTAMTTYWSEMDADGTLYGECPNQGVLMSKDGPVTVIANGAGRLTEDGGASFRGSAFFKTAVPTLSRLMGCAWYTSGMLMPTGMEHGTFGSGSSQSLSYLKLPVIRL
ncbi:MAG: hypothetical protein Ct9H300mP25_13680 [Acidobacteriota bacterium]|nr:MAG: hypothetical protein Ct9H300mP25_13680 [Acidobacteriota bacterium]